MSKRRLRSEGHGMVDDIECRGDAWSASAKLSYRRKHGSRKQVHGRFVDRCI
jgi:hypothetical protein